MIKDDCKGLRIVSLKFSKLGVSVHLFSQWREHSPANYTCIQKTRTISTEHCLGAE